MLKRIISCIVVLSISLTLLMPMGIASASGRIEYKFDQATVDNITYENGEIALLELSAKDVIAIFDIYGKVRYVNNYIADSSADTFYGYVVGYKKGEGLNSDKEMMRVIDVNAPGAPFKDFYFAKNIEFAGGLTEISDITNELGKLPSFEAGKEVFPMYEFEFNSKGEITLISKLKEYEGFEGSSWTGGWGSFLQDANPYLAVAGKKLYIPKTTPVICIKDDGNEVVVEKIEYSKLVGKSCNNKIRLKFYGYDNKPDLKLVVMLGEISVVSGTKGTGIVDRIGKRLDAEGEEVTSVNIDGKNYEVMESSSVIPTEGDFVSYTISLFDESAVVIEAAIDLKDDFSGWHGKTYGKSRFIHGTVVKADRLKTTVEVHGEIKIGDYTYKIGDEICYYYEIGKAKFYGVNEDCELTTLAYYDIQPGMEIVMGVETDANSAGSIAQMFTRID